MRRIGSEPDVEIIGEMVEFFIRHIQSLFSFCPFLTDMISGDGWSCQGISAYHMVAINDGGYAGSAEGIGYTCVANLMGIRKNFMRGVWMYPREQYLKEIISKKDNGRIKIITGLRRSGKSVLLFILNRGRMKMGSHM